MKKIEAIIRPEKLNDVKIALSNINVQGMTVSNVMGFGKQKGYTQIYRGQEIETRLLPKIKLEVVVPTEKAEKVIAAIAEASKTGEFGDGKIFVYDILEAIRIRTGEHGENAL
ncbi:P-II family nitrogen regulator [Desulfosporosinus sp. BICA1-9]|uniref:P-II family nitrogen regulator n=1 Tax=Desulfosporosinus sp. BICA1-9 TaxID=1531958 RepID=UPI00054B4F2E|nr:P-II family nitrogen regulator [Desulfosporosinus sp. BICA1-9]KJS47440.1 MAG: nitrogen regulatory protein P-II 1 [Peptococcaceae bacterium BRH_c23]KJS90332.1 MAG: nitrogen regulatory protein P-II 1 [Desulfosporosinus sp. BICA1-9]HBW38570.1 P-II family nitrogen regulator [Desulfosporosinus sp.]